MKINLIILISLFILLLVDKKGLNGKVYLRATKKGEIIEEELINEANNNEEKEIIINQTNNLENNLTYSTINLPLEMENISAKVRLPREVIDTTTILNNDETTVNNNLLSTLTEKTNLIDESTNLITTTDKYEENNINNEQEHNDEQENNKNLKEYEEIGFDGKRCILTTKNGLEFLKNEKNELINAVDGNLFYNMEIINEIGITHLEDLSNLKCGILNYDQYAYCAKLKFFGKKNIKESRNLFIRNNPKNIDDYKKSPLQDFALVLIEGCIECKYNNDPIRIIFGPIKDVCPENEEIISQIGFNLNEYNKGFIIGGILHERLCPSRETLQDKIELAPLR